MRDFLEKRFLNWSALDYSLLALMVVLSFIVHAAWFTVSPIISGDWAYFDSATISSWTFPFENWINFDGLGRQITQTNFSGLFSLYGLLGAFGLSFSIISRLLFFLPLVILTPLLSYRLFKHISKNTTGSLLAALLYTFNTNVLIIHGGHLNIAMAYALAPLAVRYAIDTKPYAGVKLGLTMGVIGLYEVRIALIVFGLSVILMLGNRLITKRSNDVLKIGVATLVWLGLSLYWLLPRLVASANFFGGSDATPRPLNWIGIDDAVALHHPFWSTSGATDFEFNSPSIVALVLPLVLIGLLALRRQYFNYKTLGLYGAISALTLFAIIQEQSIFAGVYRFLYNNVPLAFAYRESSKFYFLIAIILGILLAITFAVYVTKRAEERVSKIGSYVLVTIVVLSSIVNIWPFIASRDSIDKTYVTSQASEQVRSISQRLSEDDSEYRTLWLSRTPKFVQSTAKNPALDALLIENQLVSAGVVASENLSYIFDPSLHHLANFLGVKYIAVPAADEGMQYRHFSDMNAEEIIASLRANENLTEIQDGLFVNETYKNRFYASNNLTQLDGSIDGFSGVDSAGAVYLFDSAQNTDQINTEVAQEINLFDVNRITFEDGQLAADAGVLDSANVQLIANAQSGQIEPIAAKTENLVQDGSFDATDEDFDASDCSNFDRTPLEANGISGVIGSDSEQRRFADIAVVSHTACFSRQIEAETDAEFTDYFVSFRYKTSDIADSRFSLYPADSAPLNRFRPLEDSAEWRTHRTIISTNQYQNGTLSIIFYANSEVAGASASLQVDDIEIYGIDPLPQLHARTGGLAEDAIVEPEVNLLSSAGVSEHKISLSELANGVSVVFGEAFNEAWDISFTTDNGTPLAISTVHTSVNGVMNGWVVTDTGNYEGGTVIATITYATRSMELVGYALSSLTLLGVGGFLATRKDALAGVRSMIK